MGASPHLKTNRDAGIDWYTQPVFTQAASRVMGSIDLDPASCEEANALVQATDYYTKEQNGLLLPWYGNVWLNPPFTGGAAFVKRLVAEYEQGNVKQAVLCFKNTPTYQYLRPVLLNYRTVETDDRVKFILPGGKLGDSALDCGIVFIYFGQNVRRFELEFCKFGHIVERYRITPSTCAECRQEFDPKTHGGEAKLYCSKACKQRAYRARVTPRVTQKDR